jgi:Flp pilus assembly protein TadG
MTSHLLAFVAVFFRHIANLRADRRGNVAVMMGFLFVPLLGAWGVAFEVGNWYLTTRAMQNAADSAAVAAATNGSSSYATEAAAVAAQYGYVNGTNTVTVTASNTATCPSGGNTCYSVTITSTKSLLVSQVVGYGGNATLNGAPAQKLTSTAIATQSTQQVPLCMLALGASGITEALTGNGTPNANLAGCNIMSNTGANCNGHNLQADHGLAHTTDSGCGVDQVSNVPTVNDPYYALHTLIPPNNCTTTYPTNTYPQEGSGPHPSADPRNQLSGSLNWSGNQTFCGDVQLTGDVTINTPPAGGVLVVENGQLDLNGFNLITSNGSALTIVFSGDNGSYTHSATNSSPHASTLNITAPNLLNTTPPTPQPNWSGVAMYQDPSLTSGVDINYAGNNPTWDITGLVYAPHSSVIFSGAVNKSSNGASCFVMVADNYTINGTGSIFDTGGCSSAGLIMPQATIPTRGQLVF